MKLHPAVRVPDIDGAFWLDRPTWGEVRRGEIERMQLHPLPRIAALQERFSVRYGRGDGAYVLYLPHAYQAVAHACRYPNVLYGGAFAGGKSMWLRWHLILAALRVPRFRGLLMRRQLVDLEKTHIDKLEVEVPPSLAVYRKSEMRLKFPNGSVIQFGHCQHEKDFKNWLSTEWEIMGLDEATWFTPRQLRKLQGRLRTNKPHLIVPQYCLATNPGGPGQMWIVSRCVKKNVTPEEDPHYNPDDYGHIQGEMKDNPHIDEQHSERLRMYSPEEQRAYRKGDWDSFIGQFFKQLEKDVHGFNFPEDLPDGWEDWPQWRSYDWGYSAGASMGWWTMDPAGNVYRIRDLFERRMEVEEFMGLARDLTGDVPIRYTIADPACWDDSRGRSIAARAAASGVPLTPANPSKAAGVKAAGWSLTRSYIDPSTLPMIFVALQCRYWWGSVVPLIHDDNKPEDLAPGQNDHGADETRYFLTSRPLKGSGFQPAGEVSEKPSLFRLGSPERMEQDYLKTGRDLGYPAEGGLPADPIFGTVY